MRKTYWFEAIIGDVLQPIIGMDFLSTTGSVLLIDPSSGMLKRKNMVLSITGNDLSARIKQVMTGLPNISKVDLKGNANMTPLEIDTGSNKPVYSKVRPLFGDKKNQIETEIRKWESEGIIERVNEPVLWASPIHSVKKKDGTWRVCGDFSRLNNITKLDKYPCHH